MVQLRKKDRKLLYFKRFNKVLAEYDKCFIVGVDNVRSQQMQQIRHKLRGNAEVVMGKNTMIKKCLREHLAKDPRFEKLMPLIKENVGFVFTKGDLSDVRELVISNRVAAPAKAGVIAQCDVTVQPVNTGLGPEKTSFFQALSISTKIIKGTIEITNAVPLIKAGTRVGASEATLLTMLKIMPFTYGLELKHVFDAGTIYSPDLLDIKASDMIQAFQAASRNVAAISFAINHPTMASVPHTLVSTFKKLLAVSISTDYTFTESEKIKEYIKDPSKFAGAAPAAAPAAAAGGKAAPAAKAPEPESESDDDMGMDLFG